MPVKRYNGTDFEVVAGDGSQGATGATGTSALTTTGDILYRNATVPVRLGIGTAGQVLAVNSGATAPEWVTAASGAFVFINGAPFTAVTSVSAPNSSFTSTYDNYRVIFQLSAAVTTDALSLRLRASGTDSSAANYYSAQNRFNYLGSRSDTAQSGATSFGLGSIDAGNPGYTQYVLDFITPQLAQFTNININGSVNVITSVTGIASFNAATQFDAFSFIKATGTMTGKYRIYGYQNS